MVIIWNREVNIPLTDLKMEKNLLSLSLKIFKKFFTVEINKVYGCDIRINRAKSDPLGNFKKNKNIVNVDMETHSEDGGFLEEESLLNEESMPINMHTNANSLTCGLGSNFPIIQDSKTSILEDVYTFDFQAKYFLEQ